MIELKLKGNLLTDHDVEKLAENDRIEVKTEMSAYFEARHEWNIGIINAANEIKVGMFHVMANALPELAECSGETPKVVAQIICKTIGCDIREFREFLESESKR